MPAAMPAFSWFLWYFRVPVGSIDLNISAPFVATYERTSYPITLQTIGEGSVGHLRPRRSVATNYTYPHVHFPLLLPKHCHKNPPRSAHLPLSAAAIELWLDIPLLMLLE